MSDTDYIFDINGHLVDLRKCIPLKMGVLRDLQLAGVDATDIKAKDFQGQCTYLLTLVKRLDKTITIEDIDEMGTDAFTNAVQCIGNLVQGQAVKVARPLEVGSTTLTSSEQSTDGVLET